MPGPRPHLEPTAQSKVTAAQAPPPTLRYEDSEDESTAFVNRTPQKSKDERFYDAHGITELPNGYRYNNEEMSRLPAHLKALYDDFK